MELRNDNHALYDYMASRKKVYDVLMPVQCRHAIVSEANYIVRGHCACGDEIGIRVHPEISAISISDRPTSMSAASSTSDWCSGSLPIRRWLCR